MWEFESVESDTSGASSEKEALAQVIQMLQAELGTVQEQAKKSTRMVGLVIILIGGYLFWAGAQLSKMLDPEQVASAATGLAIEAVPTAGDSLRTLVVDGAPDLARAGSQSVIDLIPAYREVLEQELTPVVDEVSVVLAQTAMQGIVKSAGEARSPMATQAALQAGADAVVKRVDIVLLDALDAPTDDQGPTARATIEASLLKLKRVDAGLKKLAAGRGDAKERELILSWIGLLQRFDADAEKAAIQAYKQGQRVDD